MALFDKGDGGNPHQDLQQGIDQMQQMYGQMQGMLNPFVHAGQQALPQYQSAFSPMLDPQAFYQKMMSGYTETPQAKLRQQEGEQAFNRSAAASGMLGSGALGKAVSNFTQQNIAADQQNYLNNMMGIYGGGLQGYQDLIHTGLQGGSALGQIGQGYAQGIGNMYGKMSEQDWAQRQQNNQNMWGMLGLGGSLVGSAFGGGFGGGGLPYPKL